MLVVGRIVGETGLAAISNASMISFIINSICIGVTMGGTVFVFGYNAVCSIMKGFGDSKSPLYFIAVATVINIVLDVILVGPYGMGTKGAAYATISSQGTSLLISIIHLKRKNFVFDFKVQHFVIKRNKLIVILKVGLPAAIQMVVVNISYLLITGMLNNFGVSVAAAAGIGLKINTFAGMPCWAIGLTLEARKLLRTEYFIYECAAE